MAKNVNNRRPQSDSGQRQADRSRRSSAARKGMTCSKMQLFILLFFISGTIGTFFVIRFENELTDELVDKHRTAADGGGEERSPPSRQLSAGSSVRFRPSDLIMRLKEQGRRLDRLRFDNRHDRIRPPRLALVVGNMNRDSQTLMLLTLVEALKELRYSIMVFALEDGETRFLWEHVQCQVLILKTAPLTTVDWSIYEGVILSSLEAQRVVTSLMQHPFNSVPLIWIVQEDILGKRLPAYEDYKRDLLTDWRNAFHRANVVVFPDFSLPMMYTPLDTGNFYVIPGSPVNVWEAKIYTTSHSRYQLRQDNGFNKSDLIILVIGSYFFYDVLPWEYSATMNAFAPGISKITRTKGLGGTIKFLFLCGTSTLTNDSAFQELASRMGFPTGSVKQYGVDGDVNSLLLMADVVLYASFREEQSFPPLLLRAMSFRVPIIVPDLDIIKKYVVDQVHGLIFDFNPDTLVRAFSLLIEDMKLSDLADNIASSGKLLSENMLASEFITEYAKLLENVLQFPSDVMLPLPLHHLKRSIWAWDLIEKENEQSSTFHGHKDFKNNVSIIDFLEHQMDNPEIANNTSTVNGSTQDLPTNSDWDALTEIEILEDYEKRENEEVEDRTDRNLGSWEELYQSARKAERQSYSFEKYERNEIELEKTGQQLCIYEIYNGEGVWPMLHHDSLYRGISLLKAVRRPRSDDVDGVARLPILNNTYRELLCEFGAMFSIANKVDSVHTIPWIGFQSWQAAGRKVSLSVKAEDVLEHTILENSQGDVVYYWASMSMNHKREDKVVDFWSMCDVLNAGDCRTVFEDAFRVMYGLPKDMKALPPMPNDGDNKWSILHCWVMPTSSFLEFVMFSRMLVDSIDSLIQNNGNHALCLLGSSELEKKHCYCRVLDVLVNVWAYHSGRRMVYLDPNTGETMEQHPIKQRTGKMWMKYFNATLLKDMDEDLAEEADDGVRSNDRWLWPLTGEVHWQGIFDREREDKYRHKMDKKRKNKEKILDRQQNGYKQKSLG